MKYFSLTPSNLEISFSLLQWGVVGVQRNPRVNFGRLKGVRIDFLLYLNLPDACSEQNRARKRKIN